MSETLTRTQAKQLAQSIVRDELYNAPEWPTQEQVDAFFKTALGKEIARLFEESRRQKGSAK